MACAKNEILLLMTSPQKEKQSLQENIAKDKKVIPDPAGKANDRQRNED